MQQPDNGTQLIHEALDPWFDHPSDSWNYLWSPSKDRLYSKHAQSWHYWTHLPTLIRTSRYCPQGTIDAPTDLARASISCMGLSITLLNTGSINLQPSQDHNTHCLWESLVALPINTIWAIKNSYIAESDNGSYIATAIANNKDVALSGGSQKAQMGTSAFTIEGPTKDKQIIGVNIAPDNIEDGDSQRCELSGIYAIVIMVNTVCEIHLITFGSITVGCNNISALQVFNDDYVFAPIQKDFDLLTAVQNKIHDSPISWIGHHIHGHQDNLNQSLDRWATMNVKMDSTAKAYWNYLKESGYCGPV